MKLHNDKDLFETLVIKTSEKLGIVPVIIEKDYYVTLFLREVVKRQPDIIFKGGTSLSKCYHQINRFSEDIDLNIESENKPTEGQRRRPITDIKEIQMIFTAEGTLTALKLMFILYFRQNTLNMI